jgi:hypothetical protein
MGGEEELYAAAQPARLLLKFVGLFGFSAFVAWVLSRPPGGPKPKARKRLSSGACSPIILGPPADLLMSIARLGPSENDQCHRAIARAQCVGGDHTAVTRLADARIAASGTVDDVAAGLRRLGGAAEPGQG